MTAIRAARLLVTGLISTGCAATLPAEPTAQTDAVVASALQDCGPAEGWTWNLPEGFPRPAVPSHNPMSTAKVQLGRWLFYDARLSRDGTVACSSCHDPAAAFADPRGISLGVLREPLRRNSPGLQNVAYYATLTWASSTLHNLSDHVAIPLFADDPMEMGAAGREAQILTRLDADPQLQALFHAAYPQQSEPLNFGNIRYALASFTRGLVSANSPFDRWTYLGDNDALSDSAKRGMALFYGERLKCSHCHGGFHLSTSSYTETNPSRQAFFANTGSSGITTRPTGDQGLYELTGVPSHRGAFRPPSLRNVAMTPPYMHDGSMKDLSEVLEFYASADGRPGGNNSRYGKSSLMTGFTLSDQESDDLIHFLESLTDPDISDNPCFLEPPFR